jgi:hypothetical protein
MAVDMDDDVASYVDIDVASYMDDDVASYVDDDMASYVDDDVASYVDDDVAINTKFQSFFHSNSFNCKQSGSQIYCNRNIPILTFNSK